ncbi:MAG: PP2C family protein-serine/threonine phosphatase [Planctomycetota bacterium]|jgi:serine phosphatase RsbU (regulator of sigma subunit)
MKILAIWDNEHEADLVSMYLGIDDNEVTALNGAEAVLEHMKEPGQFDIILMPIDLPEPDRGFEIFEQVQRTWPNSPIVGACKAADVFRIVRFMANGMSAYVIRDEAGDYMFMLQAILDSTVDAVRAAREQQLAEKLREEVESVRKLQESVIPKHLEAPHGYTICGRYEPSQIRVLGGHPVTMAGGDYYDVFTLEDNKIVMLVGDASGHGMKAAMSIMTMHTLVRMIRTHEYQNTAHFVEEINRQLYEQSIVNDEGGFITMLYAILDVEAGTLEWTSAGHPAPLLHDLTSGEVYPLGPDDAGGLPLAVLDEADYETYKSTIPNNIRMLLYTDGLEEAFPEGIVDKHNQFGVEGIINTLKESTDRTAKETLQALFDDSNAFTKGSGRHDDTSVVLLERREEQAGS